MKLSVGDKWQLRDIAIASIQEEIEFRADMENNLALTDPANESLRATFELIIETSREHEQTWRKALAIANDEPTGRG